MIWFLFTFLLRSIGGAEGAENSVRIPTQLYGNRDWAGIRSLMVGRCKTIREIEVVTENVSRLRDERTNCDAQLDGASVPVACFRLMDLEGTLVQLDSERSQRFRKGLEIICLERAKRQTSRVQIRSLLEEASFQGPCRVTLNEVLMRVEYSQLSQDPRGVLDGRYLK